MAKDDYDIDPKDSELFRDSIRDAVPLGEDKPTSLPPKRTRSAPPADIHEPIEYPHLSDHIREEVAADTVLKFRHTGISFKVFNQLKKGEFAVEGALDLHGATVDQARDMLVAFLLEAKKAHLHCVRIIHGHGSHRGEPPILKNHVNAWLQQLPQILAFCSAPRHDGGTGAIYVLLKR